MQADQGGSETGDYEYDESHDLDPGATSSEREERSEPIEVVTATDYEGGDLSYDLAHDIRPADRP